MQSLAARGFVRPAEPGRFRFRHVLVQDAVYRAAPKRLRAELHERFVDRFEGRPDGPADADEFAGYHLEQAYRLRTELGESDRRTERLAEDAGRRLGEAGVRAVIELGDVPASAGLLRRATSLLSPGTLPRGDLLCDLAIALDAAGESQSVVEVLESAIDESQLAGERRTEVRARMELEYFRLPRTSGATADALLEAASVAIPVLEAAQDYRCLGRAWLLSGWVHGARRGQHKLREEAAQRALGYYKQSTWPTSVAAGELATSLYYGPTPISEGTDRCEALLRDEATTQFGQANVRAYLGGLVAQGGDFTGARRHIAWAREAYDELGQRTSTATFTGAMLGDIELLDDDAVAAEATFRWVCEQLERAMAYSRLASRAGDLAEALYRQGRFDEAADWVLVSESHSAHDDVDARLLWMPVCSKLAAQRGAFDEALAIGQDAVALAATTDGLNRRAAIQMDLGEVLVLAGRAADASTAFAEAIELFERKGNIVGAARVRQFRDDPALV
jgi:tetratricopeptide (TPR) repeat protein